MWEKEKTNERHKHNGSYLTTQLFTYVITNLHKIIKK